MFGSGLLLPRGSRQVTVIELHGLIAARPGGLSLSAAGPAIDRAFRRAGRRAHIVLDIESPGGSPVQSELIAARIRRRAHETGATVHAAIGEVGASGGYWLACAADDIRATAMSVVGSIGVVGGGFGLDGLIARWGVSRRLYTAGENKARLDPFSPERPEDVAFAERLMADIHARFKDWVRQRRGGKLRAPEEKLFDGSFMLGGEARDAGLVDKVGTLDELVRELGGRRAVRRVYRPQRRLFAMLPRLAARALIEEAQAAAWAPRLGL